jgi:hypothetical protein
MFPSIFGPYGNTAESQKHEADNSTLDKRNVAAQTSPVYLCTDDPFGTFTGKIPVRQNAAAEMNTASFTSIYSAESVAQTPCTAKQATQVTRVAAKPTLQHSFLPPSPPALPQLEETFYVRAAMEADARRYCSKAANNHIAYEDGESDLVLNLTDGNVGQELESGDDDSSGVDWDSDAVDIENCDEDYGNDFTVPTEDAYECGVHSSACVMMPNTMHESDNAIYGESHDSLARTDKTLVGGIYRVLPAIHVETLQLDTTPKSDVSSSLDWGSVWNVTDIDCVSPLGYAIPVRVPSEMTADFSSVLNISDPDVTPSGMNTKSHSDVDSLDKMRTFTRADHASCKVGNEATRASFHEALDFFRKGSMVEEQNCTVRQLESQAASGASRQLCSRQRSRLDSVASGYGNENPSAGEGVEYIDHEARRVNFQTSTGSTPYFHSMLRNEYPHVSQDEEFIVAGSVTTSAIASDLLYNGPVYGMSQVVRLNKGVSICKRGVYLSDDEDEDVESIRDLTRNERAIEEEVEREDHDKAETNLGLEKFRAHYLLRTGSAGRDHAHQNNYDSAEQEEAGDIQVMIEANYDKNLSDEALAREESKASSTSERSDSKSEKHEHQKERKPVAGAPMNFARIYDAPKSRLSGFTHTSAGRAANASAGRVPKLTSVDSRPTRFSMAGYESPQGTTPISASVKQRSSAGAPEGRRIGIGVVGVSGTIATRHGSLARGVLLDDEEDEEDKFSTELVEVLCPVVTLAEKPNHFSRTEKMTNSTEGSRISSEMYATYVLDEFEAAHRAASGTKHGSPVGGHSAARDMAVREAAERGNGRRRTVGSVAGRMLSFKSGRDGNDGRDGRTASERTAQQNPGHHLQHHLQGSGRGKSLHASRNTVDAANETLVGKARRALSFQKAAPGPYLQQATLSSRFSVGSSDGESTGADGSAAGCGRRWIGRAASRDTSGQERGREQATGTTESERAGILLERVEYYNPCEEQPVLPRAGVRREERVLGARPSGGLRGRLLSMSVRRDT